ncbi:glycosyltransferase family 1 protein [Candidatus Uhrbacteria bacterium]|nr:glycosyltransferase family 1 protein [Candidatus Uhrbacteria bacterium]
MRIAIDARMMGPLNTRGIGRYVEELVRAMLIEGPQNQFVLLARDPSTSPFLNHPNVEHIKADIQWYTFQEQIKMPALLRQARADVVHIPHWNVPFLYREPFLVTIHDLLLRRQPFSAKISTRHPFLAWLKFYAYRGLLRDVVSRAKLILVPTQFVRDEVREFYSVSDDQLMVTGEGLSDFPPADASGIPSGKFLFYLGSAYPHKRLDLLLDSWTVLSKSHQDLQLVLAGEKDVFMQRHMTRVEQERLPRVFFPGRLPDSELRGFLEHASLFVFPSSHEGFGLPPLEALSCNCPVVSSDAPCLREVLPKEAVFFFRNGDRDDMIRAIETVLGDLPAARAGAQRASQKVREQWTWQTVARKTLSAYDQFFHAKKNGFRENKNRP